MKPFIFSLIFMLVCVAARSVEAQSIEHVQSLETFNDVLCIQ